MSTETFSMYKLLVRRYLRRATFIACIISTPLIWIWTTLIFRPIVYSEYPQNVQGFRGVPVNSSIDNPGGHLYFLRFDVIVKLVYAYYYSVHHFVPSPFAHAYSEHLRVWNNFQESCSNVKPHAFDMNAPCKNKTSEQDFVSAFQNTIDSIQANGFEPNTSRIPVNENGVILNGAHRLAAATVLSKDVTFQYFNTSWVDIWPYSYFQKVGMQKNISDLVMLEWMKLQLKLPKVTMKVYILSIFSENQDKKKSARNIVSEKCSKDKGILYEKRVTVNKLGMTQLVRHMYGNQGWLSAKIKEMLSLFKSSTFTIQFVFFFGKNLDELTDCKYEIRKLYNHRSFKSSAHIPDSPEESLILAEMILNPNSVQFLNYGENGLDCQGIATELAKRSSLEPISTLPGIYIGRDDLMFDSGSVMHIFNLRKRTDVDILFLNNIDQRILGNKNGYKIEAHAFKENAISPGRPWGEDHFSDAVKTKWDLFYDPRNFGYCYGIKFVSLQQLVRYKVKRNEPQKDKYDVSLILDLIHSQHPGKRTILDNILGIFGWS